MVTNDLITKLKEDFPNFSFVIGPSARWSPSSQQISYKNDSNNTADLWGVLHELGHAIMDHRDYSSDIGLIKKEVEAWEKADVLANLYNLAIAEEYKQNCLETYRDWLYKRSTCPNCGRHGIQNSQSEYYCINCGTKWSVTTSRFCRPYRGSTKYKKAEA